MSEELLSTEEAAVRMKRSVKWVQYLILHNKLPAQKVGRTYIIKASDVDSYEHQPRGKPPAGETTNGNETPKRRVSSKRAQQASSRK